MTDQLHTLRAQGFGLNVTPPRKLVRQWITEARSQDYCSITEQVAYRTAQWVYEQCGKANEAQLQKARDEEREACCEWLVREGWFKYEHEAVEDLRADRRPKPPSLKEQALEALSEMEDDCLMVTYAATIRRALESLPDD